MHKLLLSSAIFFTITLGGCVSRSNYEPEPIPSGYDPAAMAPQTGGSALNNREPDTCHAADYQHLQGQNQAAVAGAGITRPTRMVTPGGIVSQEEYDSFRINFHLDPMGTIVRITCG